MSTATGSRRVFDGQAVRVGLGSRAVPLVIGLVAAAVVFVAGWRPSFWSDEAATVAASRLSVDQLLSFTQGKDAVHLAYYLVAHAWSSVLGSSEASLRGLSSLAVGVSAGGLTALGRIMRRPGTGLVAAAVFTALPRTTYMGIEARSFALSAAVVVVATCCLVAASGRGGLMRWVAYTALTWCAAQIFIYVLLLVPAHVLFVWLRQRARILPCSLAALSAAALSVPLLMVVAGQKEQIGWLATQPSVNAWTLLVEPYFESSWLAAAVCLAFIAVRAFRRVRRFAGDPWFGVRHWDDTVLLALLWTLTPLALLLVGNVVAGPLYLARYLSFCAPGMALLVASALAGLTRRQALVFLVVLAGAVAPTFVAQRGEYAKNGGSDLRNLASWIDQEGEAGDGIFFDPDAPVTQRTRQAALAYPDAFTGVDDIALVRPFYLTGSFSDEVREFSSLDGSLARVQRLWIATSAGTSINDVDEDDLLAGSGFHLVERKEFQRTELFLFSK
jgi:mannosyltransferase